MSFLPVSEVFESLVAALRHAPQVLLHAPTGAGKSTWLPLKLLSENVVEGRIIMLEPRRIAARNVAHRLAQQLGEQPGETVGYRMRADNKISAGTKIEVVTEGILTRMLQSDPMLEGVGMVILDEFHERSLQADLALALLLEVQQGLREDLKLLIMSATLDSQRLQALLPLAPVVISEGRSYPVERRYIPLSPHERFEDAVTGCVSTLLKQQPGSLLLFLPGVAEIRRVQTLLEERIAPDVDLCPLYGALPLTQQQQAILPSPPGRRKVVLATNIAETSLTIEGIRLVVDTGLERQARFDLRSGLNRLVTQRISKASMIQRAGRAGRLEPGVCWHLFSEEQAGRAAEQDGAEILHSDLTGLCLELLQWGCQDIHSLCWIDEPPENALQAAQTLLKQLGALDEQGRLSAKGRQMAVLGCEPRLAAMLYNASSQGIDALSTAAMLAAILEEPPRSDEPDLREALIRPVGSWQRRAQQLVRRLHQKMGKVEPEKAALLLVTAFPDRIACRRGQQEKYLLSGGLGTVLPAHSALSRCEWLICAGLLQGANSSDSKILSALPLSIEQLLSRYPEYAEEKTAVEWDEEKGTLRAWKRTQIGRIVLKQQPQARPSETEFQQALLEWIRVQGLDKLPWNEEARQLRLRLQCARKWLPEYDWPDVSDDALLSTLERWLLPMLVQVKDIHALKQINLSTALSGLLDWATHQKLDTLLPTHYTVPTGSRLPVRYDSEQSPLLSVRLQEMFGEQKTPSIADGRVALVLSLLSPAHRPLQITRDLATFWQGAYREVQKEMKGRYPKHVWPDDPANSAPTKRTKRHQPK